MSKSRVYEVNSPEVSEGDVLRAQAACDAVPRIIEAARADRELIIEGLADRLVAYVAGRVVESQAGVAGPDPVATARLLLDIAMRADVALSAGRMSRS